MAVAGNDEFAARPLLADMAHLGQIGIRGLDTKSRIQAFGAVEFHGESILEFRKRSSIIRCILRIYTFG
ncbi:MAG TPA: hypothetical protein DEA90_10420 [Opitutae bacterium]|nr:hypothetical protein [Opitutae bacterium]